MVEQKITLDLKWGFLSKKVRLLLDDDNYLCKQEVKKKPYISHFLDEDEWFSNSDKDKYDQLKQEKQLKQPYASNSLNDNYLDMEKVWITLATQLERFEEHCFDILGQMASRKIELSSLEDLFTSILIKAIEERYHHRVVIESKVDKGKATLAYAFEQVGSSKIMN